MNKVLLRGPWFLKVQPLALFPWKLNFQPLLKHMHIIPIWLQLLELSLELMNPYFFSLKLASNIKG